MASMHTMALLALACFLMALGAADAAATKGAKLGISSAAAICQTSAGCTGCCTEASARRGFCAVLKTTERHQYCHRPRTWASVWQRWQNREVPAWQRQTWTLGLQVSDAPCIGDHPPDGAQCACQAHCCRPESAVISDAQVQEVLGQELVPGCRGPDTVRVLCATALHNRCESAAAHAPSLTLPLATVQ